MTSTFYDDLAEYHHLIYENWPASIERQASLLASLIGPPPRAIADVAAGIGTQSLGLAARGYRVVASDLSPRALARLQREAEPRGLTIESRVDDMRVLATHADHSAGVVIALDNSIPHLLTDDEIRDAFVQFIRVLEPGGLCILSVRDYAALPPARLRFNAHGVRELPGGSHVSCFQVWEHDGPHYDLAQYFVFNDGTTKVFRTRYYAVAIDRLIELMREAGFENVQRNDELLYQPLLIATAPAPPARSA